MAIGRGEKQSDGAVDFRTPVPSLPLARQISILRNFLQNGNGE